MSERLNKENKKEFVEDLKRKASFTSKKRIRHLTDNLLSKLQLPAIISIICL